MVLNCYVGNQSIDRGPELSRSMLKQILIFQLKLSFIPWVFLLTQKSCSLMREYVNMRKVRLGQMF